MRLVQMDLSAIPVLYTRQANRFDGVSVTLFGLLVLGLSALGLPRIMLVETLHEGRAGSMEFWVWLLPFVCGISLLVWGLWRLTYCATTRIDERKVVWERQALFLRRRWEEPLNNYRGISLSSKWWHSPAPLARQWHLIHFLELHHDNSRRCVRLFESTAESLIYSVREAACHRLGLPALPETPRRVRWWHWLIERHGGG